MPLIEIVDKCRHLGLVIDDCMKWTCHMDTVCDKLRPVLAKVIKRTVPIIYFFLSSMLYNILIPLYNSCQGIYRIHTH